MEWEGLDMLLLRLFCYTYVRSHFLSMPEDYQLDQNVIKTLQIKSTVIRQDLIAIEYAIWALVIFYLITQLHTQDV